MKTMNPAQMPWYLWAAVAAILLSQATWLFLDARRRGASPWLWGGLGLIQFPLPLLIYWLLVRRRPPV